MPGLWVVLAVVLLVVCAGVFSAAEAALVGFSPARAEELAEERRPGAKRLVAFASEPGQVLNTAILLRLLSEMAATILVALEVHDLYDGRWWPTLFTSLGIMLVVSFVLIGVGPRTLGRQHHERVALVAVVPLTAITAVLGPIPRLLILVGNAITPGRGFREGPFNTETELREMVDLAEASSLIEGDERRMIHSVFELGDTTARAVMVPRGEVIFIERHKNLRQSMSLFLRSGFSRIPVVDENLDNIVGIAYLKDVVRRDFEAPDAETTQRIDTVMRTPVWVPESKPVDDLLREMQARRQHIGIVIDEYGGTAGLITIEDVLEEIVGEITDEYDASDDSPTVLPGGAVRVPARYQLADLDELDSLGGVRIEDEDVDSVRGLMAKHLGLVPIPGSVVEVDGLRFTAEETAGRRNQIGTVLIEPLPDTKEDHDD
ncbi:hemolysin family protein [Nocardioides sp.]|uniref:hemolysin family protein n=1 Tax=Nocardioides sp. TaxID=35761 RepID=UPI002610E674|nr:hemolysin family protein [Nocardioides sp.]